MTPQQARPTWELFDEIIAIEGPAEMRELVGVGPLAGVEPRSLQSAYPLACAGTYPEGARDLRSKKMTGASATVRQSAN